MLRLRPKRPFKSLAEFRTKFSVFVRTRILDDPSKWPCTICLGRGWDYDPNDEPDVIEGNKLRNRIKCSACNGIGAGPKAPFQAIYARIIKDWKEKVEKFDREEALRKSGLAKLTSDERKALGV